MYSVLCADWTIETCTQCWNVSRLSFDDTHGECCHTLCAAKNFLRTDDWTERDCNHGTEQKLSCRRPDMWTLVAPKCSSLVFLCPVLSGTACMQFGLLAHHRHKLHSHEHLLGCCLVLCIQSQSPWEPLCLTKEPRTPAFTQGYPGTSVQLLSFSRMLGRHDYATVEEYLRYNTLFPWHLVFYKGTGDKLFWIHSRMPGESCSSQNPSKLNQAPWSTETDRWIAFNAITPVVGRSQFMKVVGVVVAMFLSLWVFWCESSKQIPPRRTTKANIWIWPFNYVNQCSRSVDPCTFSSFQSLWPNYRQQLLLLWVLKSSYNEPRRTFGLCTFNGLVVLRLSLWWSQIEPNIPPQCFPVRKFKELNVSGCAGQKSAHGHCTFDAVHKQVVWEPAQLREMFFEWFSFAQSALWQEHHASFTATHTRNVDTCVDSCLTQRTVCVSGNPALLRNWTSSNSLLQGAVRWSGQVFQISDLLQQRSFLRLEDTCQIIWFCFEKRNVSENRFLVSTANEAQTTYAKWRRFTSIAAGSLPAEMVKSNRTSVGIDLWCVRRALRKGVGPSMTHNCFRREFAVGSNSFKIRSEIEFCRSSEVSHALFFCVAREPAWASLRSEP